MSTKPFDSSTRRLLSIDPASWLATLGLPATGPVRVVSSALSTVISDADTVYQVGDPAGYLAHVEMQSGRDRALPRRLLHYNVLLHHDRELPVRSVALLLRPEADGKELSGSYEVRLPGGPSHLDFRYDVVRVWTLDVESVLRGGLGVLPLAPLTNVTKTELPAIIGRMKDRLDREVSPGEAKDLWTASCILMGLKLTDEFVIQLLEGVGAMEESATYQAIIEKGVRKGRDLERIASKRETLLMLGDERFGEPDAATLAAVESITDVGKVERLLKRLLHVDTWGELLGPGPGEPA